MAGGAAIEAGGDNALCGCGPSQIRDARALACKIGCEVVPERRCRAAVPQLSREPRGCARRFARAGRKSLVDTTASRYMCASIVYVIYTSLILAIDINAVGGYYGPLYGNVAMALNRTQAAQAAAAALLAAPSALDDDSTGRRAALASEAEYDAYWGAYYGAAALEQVPIYTGATGDAAWSGEKANSLFILAAFIHFVNAWQYAYAWHGRRWNDVVLYPEYMNVIGSWLYLIAASWYARADELISAPTFAYTDGEVMRVHWVETAAASWELFAAFGWTYTWWKTFQRKPGRGCTLDDPDLHGSLGIVIPSFIYLAYNFQVLLDPATYGSNTLYIVGDAAYFAGALAYLLGALRDVGCCWWVPRFGRFPDECPDIPECCGVESRWPPRTEDEWAQLADNSADEEEEEGGEGGGGGGGGGGGAVKAPPGLAAGGAGAVLSAALGDDGTGAAAGANPMVQAQAAARAQQLPHALLQPATPALAVSGTGRKAVLAGGARAQIDF